MYTPYCFYSLSRSLFGGQVLNIEGSGFGQDPTQVDVRLGDYQCNVIRVVDNRITCVTTSTATEHHISNNAYVVIS